MKNLSRCKIIDKDINILEYEIYRIYNTNHLIAIEVHETITGNWMIIIDALWKNSLRYLYFMTDYIEMNEEHIALLKERLL